LDVLKKIPSPLDAMTKTGGSSTLNSGSGGFSLGNLIGSSGSGGISSGNKYCLRLQLAARGTQIFMHRLLNEKMDPRVAKEKSKPLVEMQDQLMKLASVDICSPYADYFREVDNYLSPLYELHYFKLGMLRTLAPIAVVYLQNCSQIHVSTLSVIHHHATELEFDLDLDQHNIPKDLDPEDEEDFTY